MAGPKHCRRVLLRFAGALIAIGSLASASIAQTPERGASGLAIPRYVSLKADRVNVRRGPGREYPIAWVFQRAGLPVEVVKEFTHWRRIRDSEGAFGWVHVRLLSGRRTALVLAWAVKERSTPPVPLFTTASPTSAVVALAQPGAVADILSCDRKWCQVVVGNFRGWLQQKLLWGVYENERIE